MVAIMAEDAVEGGEGANGAAQALQGGGFTEVADKQDFSDDAGGKRVAGSYQGAIFTHPADKKGIEGSEAAVLRKVTRKRPADSDLEWVISIDTPTPQRKRQKVLPKPALGALESEVAELKELEVQALDIIEHGTRADILETVTQYIQCANTCIKGLEDELQPGPEKKEWTMALIPKRIGEPLSFCFMAVGVGVASGGVVTKVAAGLKFKNYSQLLGFTLFSIGVLIGKLTRN